MKNKILEALLKKTKQKHLIRLIEKCENGRIIEIKAVKEELMTNDEKVDNDVLGYLKDLNIKITFVKHADIYKGKNHYYKQPAECPSDTHAISSNSDMDKVSKLRLFEDSGFKMFKLDEKSYVCCPDCSQIIHITHS
jgi:hypothetical protein